MNRTDALHALSTATSPTQEGILALARALAARWPDRPLIQLAGELQAQRPPAPERPASRLTLADVIAHLQLLGTGQASPYTNAELIQVIEQHQDALTR